MQGQVLDAGQLLALLQQAGGDAGQLQALAQQQAQQQSTQQLLAALQMQGLLQASAAKPGGMALL